MKVKVSHTSKWIGSPPIHYCQLVEVWFDKQEYNNFKRDCYHKLNKYYDFFEIEMFLNTEERKILTDILNLESLEEFKIKKNTSIIYHRDYESWTNGMP